MTEKSSIITKEPLTKEERFKILNSTKVNSEVLEYLSNRFKNLTIEIGSNAKENILTLMKRGLLEGWCWQTTETAIMLLNDNDYIERGNLKFDNHIKYYHSWICFSFNHEYIFDPCLNFLCKKKLYSKIFETEVKGKTTAKEVRDFLINYSSNPIQKEKDTSETAKKIEKLMEEFFGNTLDRKKDEIYIMGNNNVNSPMYRNNTGYKAEITNGKIKKLVAHYYLNI